ncbi:YafY family transcriptional regulator [Nonomuraea sp. 3-1Str]|uniref:helix-turn-helix transcriptional regulator n=1 Tax=Nonomuraea sp. 3-1Str TaxID=2929801 RepID=UPI00285C4F52|nr:YafY family protein [Nonomuraea sp. 3-1Str]MDR8412737.1 YafY family transcriptional regulator [Nonomuraea sp. 3-1Str]
MSGTSARLLTLLSLLQTPREWPGSELAERLGVSPRTIRRDIERLRDLGYPVQASMGGAGGYRLVAGTAMPPLLLDDEEAVAIAVGLRTVTRHAVDGIDQASVRALAKLRQVLPSRLRARVGALSTATSAPPPVAGPSIDPEILTSLATTAAAGERVRFAYRSGDGAESRRHVEPYALVTWGRRWYLLAYDCERDDWRVFRVDRVERPWPTGARFAPRPLPAPDAAAFVVSKLHTLAPTYRAVVTLHAPAEYVRTRLGDGTEDVTAVDERTCRLDGRSDTLEWLAFRLLTLGCEFEVHEPPELLEHLRELGGRALRATAGAS